MKVKMILTALTEAKSPFFRPIKYSLFPPLGLSTLAAYLSADDDITLIDEHVEELMLDDQPDLVDEPLDGGPAGDAGRQRHRLGKVADGHGELP